MATIVDRLVVELGLDPKKFTQGQREAMARFKQTQDEARKGAKEFEEQVKHVQNTMQRLQRSIMAVTAAFLGGRTIKNFINEVTSANAATSRLANNFGQDVGKVDRWSKAVHLAGGEAQDAAAAFQMFSDAQQAYASGADPGRFVQMAARLTRLSQESGVAINPRSKNLDVVFQQIGEALGVVGGKDRARANYLGRELGFTPGMANLLAGGKVKEFLGKAGMSGDLTPEAAKAAEEYRQSTVRLSQAIDRMAIALTPAIEVLAKGVGKLAEWFERVFGARVGGEGSSSNLRKRFGEPPDWAKRMTGETPSSQGLRMKSGADSGDVHAGTYALAYALQHSIPELKEFTAFNDKHHGGKGQHGAGLAMDFTLKDPSKYAAVAAAIRERLAKMGVNATVADEHNNPLLGRTTGSHIHIQFPNAEEANKYQSIVGGSRTGGGAGPVDNSKKSSSVNVGTVVVHTQATNADQIARDIKPAIERTSFAMLANTGLV